VAAKKRQHTQRIAPFEHGQGGKPRIDERRRARYLLSGLTRCGYCGGYAMISAGMLGCSTARNKGTCANRVNIRRDVLEQRVLTTLHTQSWLRGQDHFRLRSPLINLIKHSISIYRT
jgi:hypothetical protein